MRLFAKGDRVADDEHPKWGIGTVVDVAKINELVVGNEVYTLGRQRDDQRLVVAFTDGRRRTLSNANSALKKVP